jgi:hypothetical protein
MSKKTIGYYRKEGKVEVISSESSELCCKKDGGCSMAVFIPLKIKDSDNIAEYNFTKEFDDLSGEIKTLFSENKSLVTTTVESSPYFLLMYIPKDNPNMTKSGILVKKDGAEFVPMTVEINNEKFLIEISGCGCSDGGYLDVDVKIKSESKIGYNLNIIGGLSKEDAKSEIENLTIAQIGRKDHQSFDQVKPLGYMTFNLDIDNVSIEMGQSLKLVPSSIRYSYTENKEIDALQNHDDMVYMQNLGREVGYLMSGSDLLVHSNINPSNLVYVADATYVLTDYLNCTPVSQFKCDLDVANTFVPPSLWEYSDSSQQSFITAMADVNETFLTLITKKRIKRLQYLSDVLIRDLIDVSKFKKRLKNSNCNDSMMSNLNFMKSFLPKEFYGGSSESWINNSLNAILYIKREINDYYISFTRENSFQALKECWDQTHENKVLQKEFESKITTIEKDIRVKWVSANSYESDWINNYVSYDRLDTLYYDVPESISDLKNQYRLIKSISREARVYSEDNKIQLSRSSLSHDWRKRRESLFGNFASLAYPFAPFLLVYFHNERELLLNVQKKPQFLTDEERNVLELSIKAVREKLSILKTNPVYFYDLLMKSEAALIDDIQLPYTSGVISSKVKAIV